MRHTLYQLSAPATSYLRNSEKRCATPLYAFNSTPLTHHSSDYVLCMSIQIMDFIVTHGKLKERDARRIFRQVVEAIDYCHDVHVIRTSRALRTVLFTVIPSLFVHQSHLECHLMSSCRFTVSDLVLLIVGQPHWMVCRS